MTIGEKIRKRRIELGLTQKEVGRRCGISDSTLRKYELGSLNPKVETIKKIANALETDYLSLLESHPRKMIREINDLNLNDYIKSTNRSDQIISKFNDLVFQSLGLTDIHQMLSSVSIYFLNPIDINRKNPLESDWQDDIKKLNIYKRSEIDSNHYICEFYEVSMSNILLLQNALRASISNSFNSFLNEKSIETNETREAKNQELINYLLSNPNFFEGDL